MSRVTEAYPEVFAGLETDVRRRVVLALGTSPDGSLPVVDDVTDLVDRICGRISFEEYLRRGRRRRRLSAGATSRSRPEPSSA